MTQTYERILVAIDGSYESELAFEKAVNISLRNQATLLLTHIIDTTFLQSVTTFDNYIYDQLEKESQAVLDHYNQLAQQKGVTHLKQILEFGNPKLLLATEIPDRENVDLIMLGATGLNTFERLVIGSSSEYILRHAKVDLLIVRDKEKLF